MRQKSDTYVDYIYRQIKKFELDSDFEDFIYGYQLLNKVREFTYLQYEDEIKANWELLYNLEKNEYNESDDLHTKIGNILLFHQIIETHLVRICKGASFLVKVAILPQQIHFEIDKLQHRKHRHIMRFLANSIEFPGKKEFLKSYNNFNDIRNDIAHNIFTNEENKVSHQCSEAHSIYQELRLRLYGDYYFESNNLKSPSKIISGGFCIDDWELGILDFFTESVRYYSKNNDIELKLEDGVEEIAEEMKWLSPKDWENH